jgi:cytochrome c peroxidase
MLQPNSKKTALFILGCLSLLLCTFLAADGESRSSRTEWFDKYRRPLEIPYPPENPFSEAKHKLGEMLFFDPMLSGSKTRSCASCHIPALSWSDDLPRAIGEKGAELPFRVPTLLNVAWVPRLGWDGHFRDLEAVAFGPILSAKNMNLSEDSLISRLSTIPRYVDGFNAAFWESGITRRKIELAIATFERSIISKEAPFDRWIKGDEKAVSEAAKRGFDLFNGKAHCDSCHSSWTFTDSSFHDIGSARDNDIGRGWLFPNSIKLRYAFKTPTLRDVARRAPYMHDGSVKTLEAVVELYDRGGIERESRSNLIFPLNLTNEEKSDLIAFMRTLSGNPEQYPAPVLPR